MANIYESMTYNNRTEPFELQVARGLIRGHTSLNISGYQPTVDGSYIPIWENATAYTYPTSATQMTLYSSSASDTNVSILINGLDANYDPISETLVLTNGTTGVLTTKQYFRIIGISVTGTVNPVGIIRLANNGKATTYAQINVNEGRSSMTIYTVPRGYTFYLAKVNCYTNLSNNQVTTYRSFTRNANGIVSNVLNAPFTQVYISDKSVPRPYPEKTDIQWQCTASSTAAIGLQIEGILIKNVE